MAKYQQIKDLKTDRLGSDIVIANARLLKDPESGDMLIQVRLKKVSDEPVSAVNVKVVCFDSDGKKVGEDITESFACNVKNGEYFGVKHPIRLEVNNAADASVSIEGTEYPEEKSTEETEKNEESAVRNDDGDNDAEYPENGNAEKAEQPEKMTSEKKRETEIAPAEVKAEDNTAKKILLGFAAATVLVIGIGAAVHFASQNKPAVDAETLIAEVSETTISSAAVTTAAKTETETATQTETQASQWLDDRIRTERAPEYDTVSINVTADDNSAFSVDEESISEVYYYYSSDGKSLSKIGVMYADYVSQFADHAYYAERLSKISKKLKDEYDTADREAIVMEAYDLKDEYAGESTNVTSIKAMTLTQSFAEFRCSTTIAAYGSLGLPPSLREYHMYDMTFNEPCELVFKDIFLNKAKDKIFNTICRNIEANPSEYIDNYYQTLYDIVYSDDLSWYFNQDYDLVISFMPWTITTEMQTHEEIIPYTEISQCFTNYGTRLLVKSDPSNIGYPHGNTIGNIMNYSAYTTDGPENKRMFYAGGVDGYSWCLSYFNSDEGIYGEVINDFTDSVLYYDGWIYYRTYSDNNCLYRIKPDGSEKTKLSSSKVSRFNIDRGKLYFRENDVFCEANLNGSRKRVLINSPCYGSFVTDGCVYYLTSDSSGIIRYDIDKETSETFNIFDSDYQIKYFTVEGDYVYFCADGVNTDNALLVKYSLTYRSFFDLNDYYLREVYSFNMTDDYIYAAVNTDGKNLLYKVLKDDFSSSSYYLGLDISREFDIIGNILYYYDEYGTPYQADLP